MPGAITFPFLDIKELDLRGITSFLITKKLSLLVPIAKFMYTGDALTKFGLRRRSLIVVFP